jgi:branched-chain amino acid transport system ATP-binding protein
MVAIARALMARPQLLVLDEPSLGLSPLLIKTVFKAIAEVHRSGTSLLLVEQNAVKALELANRGYVISSGEVLTSGSSKDLRHDARVREIYFGAAS